MNNLERAERFEELGKKFIKIAITQKTKLDFDMSLVVENECGTVACHGGFGLVALTPKYMDKTFWHGADAIGEFLGFGDEKGFCNWAEANPDIWGSEFSLYMFSNIGYKAFARDADDLLTLADIGEWYCDVSRRLKEVG
jgi:hypothetical protein